MSLARALTKGDTVVIGVVLIKRDLCHILKDYVAFFQRISQRKWKVQNTLKPLNGGASEHKTTRIVKDKNQLQEQLTYLGSGFNVFCTFHFL